MFALFCFCVVVSRVLVALLDLLCFCVVLFCIMLLDLFCFVVLCRGLCLFLCLLAIVFDLQACFGLLACELVGVLV